MTQLKRPTPYPEWVQMYRSGIPATRISVLSDVAQSVIRHHLAIAARQDPGLRAAHQAAATPPPTRITGPGQRNLKVVLSVLRGRGAAAGQRPVTSRVHSGGMADPPPQRRCRRHPVPCLCPSFGCDSPVEGLSDQASRRCGPVEAAPGRGRSVPFCRS